MDPRYRKSNAGRVPELKDFQDLRASIYGKKKFKFLLALLDPKNQQKSIQYLQSGKKTLNYSSLDPPYFDQFENANFWGKNLVKLEIGPLEKILRGVEKEEVGRN